jgi:hypothetical protein
MRSVALALLLVGCAPQPWLRIRVVDEGAAPLRVFVLDDVGAPVPAERPLLADAEVLCEGCVNAPFREKPGAYWLSVASTTPGVKPKLTVRAPGHAVVTLTVEEPPDVTEGGTLGWVIVLKREGS